MSIPCLKKGVEIIEEYVKTLPDTPGVYRMLDHRGDVLYVGKAKALKKRVKNYTQTARLSLRIQRMVAATTSMMFVHTQTETEALLLEANLIKKYKPRYNILLRDDKYFYYIEITKHPFPRLGRHRGPQKQSHQYFGPFASSPAVYEALESLHKTFRLRPCSDTFFASRKRVCLEYHLKRCHGPCVGKISQDSYNECVSQTIAFLKGKDQGLQDELARLMSEASKRQDYETAALYRDRIKALTHLQKQQTINVSSLQDADIFAVAQEGDETVIQAFFYRQGRNYGSLNLFPQRMDEEDFSASLETFLALFYTDKTPPREILLSHALPEHSRLAGALSQAAQHKVTISSPQKGEKALVMGQALMNAKEELARRHASHLSHQQNLKNLATFLGLPALSRIEVYDNSHLQGTNRVGAMVVFGDHGFDKTAYRTYKIRTPALLHGGDDYAMMREVMTRRFSPKETADTLRILPDLLLIDGGIGQINIVHEVLTDLSLHIPILGISKGPDRNAGNEQFHRPGMPSFDLQDRKDLLFFLQRLRDEAHRFAIGAHRKKRHKQLTFSKLDEIPGVGLARKRTLLQYFGSAKGVADATPQDLAKVPGISANLAQHIFDLLRSTR